MKTNIVEVWSVHGLHWVECVHPNSSAIVHA